MAGPPPHLFREMPLPGGTGAALTPGQAVVVTSPLRPQGYIVVVPNGVTTVAQLLTSLGLNSSTSTVKSVDNAERRVTDNDGGTIMEV